jgi:ABC-type Fe3+ transport system permease subunit
MKLQFSLATLLVCMTVLVIVAAVAVAVRVQEPALLQFFRNDGFEWQPFVECSPTNLEIALRMLGWGTPGLVVTVGLLWLVRRLKSRRENGPPVG